MENILGIENLVTDAFNVDFALKGFKAFFDNQMSMQGTITTEDLNMANALLVSILELSGRHAADTEGYAINLEQGGERIDQNMFIFKTTVSKENLIKAENDDIEAREDGYIEVKPSQALPYDAVLMENEKIGKKFNFVVYPIDNIGQNSPYPFKQEKKITTLLIAFYRTDEHGKKLEIGDINTFLGNLNTDASISLCQHIFDSWFSIYKSLKKEAENVLSDFLLFDIGIMERKTRIPLIAKVEKKAKGSGVLLNFDTFKNESKIRGNDKYSSSLEFKEIPGDMQIP